LRRLIVNADDFGFTKDVNLGIVDAHRNGILTATTLMANGAAFDHAVALATENPTLDVGCHLVLVGEPPYPPTVAKLILSLGKIPIYQELAGQVRKIMAAGIRPTHLDTHKHTHLLPPVLDAVARVAREFDIPWVRRPFDFSAAEVSFSKRVTRSAMGLARGRFARALQGLRTTDHFAGFQITGRYDARMLADLICKLPEGLTEFMCHPGHCSDELRGARTRLKESRAMELAALTAPEVRQALKESGVELTDYLHA
jgi:predicted glycoside hydrolase/deacetylase ChbG (UPF0249 family)